MPTPLPSSAFFPQGFFSFEKRLCFESAPETSSTTEPSAQTIQSLEGLKKFIEAQKEEEITIAEIKSKLLSLYKNVEGTQENKKYSDQEISLAAAFVDSISDNPNEKKDRDENLSTEELENLPDQLRIQNALTEISTFRENNPNAHWPENFKDLLAGIPGHEFTKHSPSTLRTLFLVKNTDGIYTANFHENTAAFHALGLYNFFSDFIDSGNEKYKYINQSGNVGKLGQFHNQNDYRNEKPGFFGYLESSPDQLMYFGIKDGDTISWNVEENQKTALNEKLAAEKDGKKDEDFVQFNTGQNSENAGEKWNEKFTRLENKNPEWFTGAKVPALNSKGKETPDTAENNGGAPTPPEKPAAPEAPTPPTKPEEVTAKNAPKEGKAPVAPQSPKEGLDKNTEINAFTNDKDRISPTEKNKDYIHSAIKKLSALGIPYKYYKSLFHQNSWIEDKFKKPIYTWQEKKTDPERTQKRADSASIYNESWDQFQSLEINENKNNDGKPYWQYWYGASPSMKKESEFKYKNYKDSLASKNFSRFSSEVGDAPSKTPVDKYLVIATLQKETSIPPQNQLNTILKHNHFQPYVTALFSIDSYGGSNPEKRHENKQSDKVEDFVALVKNAHDRGIEANGLIDYGNKYPSNAIGALGYSQFMAANLHLVKNENNQKGTLEDLYTPKGAFLSTAHFIEKNCGTTDINYSKLEHINDVLVEWFHFDALIGNVGFSGIGKTKGMYFDKYIKDKNPELYETWNIEYISKKVSELLAYNPTSNDPLKVLQRAYYAWKTENP